MVSVSPPESGAAYQNRRLHCQEAIDPVLQDVIADAQLAGWGSAELYDAIDEVIKKYRIGYSEDPDPMDENAMDIPEIALDDPKQGP